MPINRRSKNRLTIFIDDIQKLSDDKYSLLTNSNLKYSRKEIRGQIEKYLRKTIKDLLSSTSVKKISDLTHIIIENVFESQKNFEKIMEKECLYFGMEMPFLPNDQIRGHALEKLGFKTICGDLDKKALIERYTLNEITIPDYVRKGAKKQKVGWDDRVTIFEEKDHSNPSESVVENRQTSPAPEPQEEEIQKEINSSTARALEFLDETIAEETPKNPVEAEKSKIQNDKINEDESLISVIPESNDLEANTSTISEITENGNQGKEKLNSKAQTENPLILESEISISNPSHGENDTLPYSEPENSAKTVINFKISTGNIQLKNPLQKNIENSSPSKKSSDDETGDEVGLELCREIYSKTSEDNFMFRKHYSDDEEMRSSFSLPDGNDKDCTNEEDLIRKKNRWVVSSTVIIKDSRSEGLKEMDQSEESSNDQGIVLEFQEKGEINLEKFRTRQKINFQSLSDELQPSQNSQDASPVTKLIEN